MKVKTQKPSTTSPTDFVEGNLYRNSYGRVAIATINPILKVGYLVYLDTGRLIVAKETKYIWTDVTDQYVVVVEDGESI